MQTKLGSKLNILIERALDLWNGKDAEYTNTKKNNYKQANQQMAPQVSNVHQPSQADYLDHTQILPSNLQLTSMPQPQVKQVASQQSPDFNQMYQNNITPLVNAHTPGVMEAMEPMAANELGGGGGGFSSW